MVLTSLSVVFSNILTTFFETMITTVVYRTSVVHLSRTYCFHLNHKKVPLFFLLFEISYFSSFKFQNWDKYVESIRLSAREKKVVPRSHSKWVLIMVKDYMPGSSIYELPPSRKKKSENQFGAVT